MGRLQGNMSRFDFTNNLSVGIVEMNTELFANTCRKDYYFVLPNGKKIVYKSQASLTTVNAPKLRDSGEEPADFIYPTVNDAVNQIEGKETFASSDYDWVSLTYNFHDRCFEWLAKEQAKGDSVVNHAKASYFIGFDTLKNISGPVLKQGLVVPLSNKNASSVAIMRLDNLNLFVSPSTEATIQDLLDYLNNVLTQQKLTAKPVEANHLRFESLHNETSISVKAEDSLLEVLKKVGWTQEGNHQQKGSFVCSYKIRYPMPDSEAKAGHLYHEERRTLAKHTLKTSLTSFYQFIFRELFSSQLMKTAGRHFIAGQPLEFWLPSVLLLDVRKFSASIVDVKGGLDLKELAPLIEEVGVSFNTKYNLVGAILKSPVPPPDNFPCKISGKEALVFFDGTIKKAVKDLNDAAIEFVLLVRAHVDVETA